MNNMISADFYRVRRGAALRNTILSLLAMTVLMTVIILIAQSEEFSATLLENTEGMTPAEVADVQSGLAEMEQETVDIANAAAFGREMLAQAIIPFFFLPIIMAVFCADFAAGTYRNTLSYESNRTKVYWSKLALSTVLCLGLVLLMLVAGWIAGIVVFGFDGFSWGYFVDILKVFVLQLPANLSIIAVSHCIVAFAKKSGTTIGMFVVGLMGIGVLCQVLVTVMPSLDWLLLLDPLSGGKQMADYAAMPARDIAVFIGYHSAIAIATTAIGLSRFRKSDMP